MKQEQSKEDKLYDYLSGKYKKAVLTKSELAIELGVGKSTVDQYISKSEGIPPYKKLGTAKNSRVVFNLFDVAKFLANTITTN